MKNLQPINNQPNHWECKESELTLTCGESSITLCADGNVVIKGKRLIQAFEVNELKGITNHAR